MKLLTRAIEIYRNEGKMRFLKKVTEHICLKIQPKNIYFRRIRPRTAISTEKRGNLNGVQVHLYRTFDRYLPWDPTPPEPWSEFESGAVEAIREYVTEGDTVVVIGGGKGVTTTVAATETGQQGCVIVYEGAANMIEQIKNTVSTNNVRERVKTHHAIVGSLSHLDGPQRGASTVYPEEIPDCDLLEMDCEGSETDIIPALTVRPDHIIVETHGNRNEVRDQLAELGYRIVTEKPADDRVSKAKIREWGLYTIVAEYEN